MNHQNPLPFEEVSVESWTDCHRTEQNGRVWITGTCQRCQHRTSRRFGTVIVAGSAPDKQVTPGKAEAVLCDCQQAHPERPADAEVKGCGAMWWGSVNDA